MSEESICWYCVCNNSEMHFLTIIHRMIQGRGHINLFPCDTYVICTIIINTNLLPRFGYMRQPSYYLWHNGGCTNVLGPLISWQFIIHLSVVPLSILPNNSSLLYLHDDRRRHRKVFCCLFPSQLPCSKCTKESGLVLHRSRHFCRFSHQHSAVSWNRICAQAS